MKTLKTSTLAFATALSALGSNAFASVVSYKCTTASGKNVELSVTNGQATTFKIDGKSVKFSDFYANGRGLYIVTLKGYLSGQDLTINFGDGTTSPFTKIGAYGNMAPMSCLHNTPDSKPSVW